jgi:protein-S-isoprenylcysteine O-methyltransferase Ste14
MHTSPMSNAPLPFLPEPEPAAPAAPPNKKAAKTLILWVVLIVMFLGIWQFLSPSPGATPAPALPPCEPSSGWYTVAPYAVFFAILLIAYRWFVRSYGQNLDFQIAQEPGRLAMAERRFGPALEVFGRLQASYANKPAYEASAGIALGAAQLWAGRLDEAVHTLAAVERKRTVLFSSSIRTVAAAHLALAHALAGELDAAESWARETRARIAKNRDDRLEYAARLCLAEAIVTLRRGQPADASALLERNWTVMREALTANMMRVAEVLTAFAESTRGVRQANTMAERLLRVEPTLPGDFAFLGVKWPEMQAFLDAHGLGAPTP